MAKAHVYVRVQVNGSSAACHAIKDAAEHLRVAVEAAGGEWNGSAQVEADEPSTDSPAPVTEAPVADGGSDVS
jgi:hypothetical protein